MRQRWGTFSIRDHMTEAPFVSDVLLYDQLIIPVPPADRSQDEFWKKFEPESQQRCLEILGVKTDKKDGLALPIPWDASKRERFKNRMSVAAAVATQGRSPEQTYYMDPFEMTRQLIKAEFVPALPRGVSKAWTVAAYTSADAFRSDISADRRRKLAIQITHRFLSPTRGDPKHDLLKRAVDLATSNDFRRKRNRFYEWQEEIIVNDISDEKAIEELETRLEEYNNATSNAFVKEVYPRYVFTVIPITLAMTGALLSGSTTALVLGGAGGLVQLARFWKFDRKPVVEAGDLDAAAMINDARKELSID